MVPGSRIQDGQENTTGVSGIDLGVSTPTGPSSPFEVDISRVSTNASATGAVPNRRSESVMLTRGTMGVLERMRARRASGLTRRVGVSRQAGSPQSSAALVRSGPPPLPRIGNMGGETRSSDRPGGTAEMTWRRKLIEQTPAKHRTGVEREIARRQGEGALSAPVPPAFSDEDSESDEVILRRDLGNLTIHIASPSTSSRESGGNGHRSS